ncbi:MAG: hypothetical protein E7582_02570 [Ruminococcaceae bacterium]|nr:hypothetical protein [Oscillospiraceae bacterium]
MKRVSTFALASTIAGAFIGAGFVSGQELWQFFGDSSIIGIIGFIISILGLGVMSYITINLAKKKNYTNFVSVITPSENKVIKNCILVFEIVFYFCIYVIMTAGVESLISQYLNCNEFLVGIIFSLLVSVIVFIGAKGVVASFSIIVPLLVVSVLVISFITISKFDMVFEVSENFTFNSFISPFVYLSYNYFSAVGIFASVSTSVKSKRQVKNSTVLGCLFLFLLGASIILSTFTLENAATYDLPMLEIAKRIHPILEKSYAFLLTIAMLGASLSALFPISDWFENSFKTRKTTLASFITIISILNVILSLIGFKELIGIVYPFFGVVGFIIIAFVIYNAYLKKECKHFDKDVDRL